MLPGGNWVLAETCLSSPGQRGWRRCCVLREQHLQSPKGYTETLYVFIHLTEPYSERHLRLPCQT